MDSIQVVAQDVHLENIDPKNLTSDCYLVFRKDGVVDIIKARRMVDIFDHYYDLGILLKAIELSGGLKNPKREQPEV